MCFFATFMSYPIICPFLMQKENNAMEDVDGISLFSVDYSRKTQVSLHISILFFLAMCVSAPRGFLKSVNFVYMVGSCCIFATCDTCIRWSAVRFGNPRGWA